MNAARKAKNDEFYTQRYDIEEELRHYTKHFKNKTIFCNCDDPYISEFTKYFLHNFHHHGIKKLLTTCYKSQQETLFSNNDSKHGLCLEYDGKLKDGDKVPTVKEIGVTTLKQDGDFRSEECIDMLEKSDLVVTNPPFSLFQKYLSLLIEYDKKFIIVGNLNSIATKNVFKLLSDNKMWLGYGFRGGGHSSPNINNA